MIGFTPSLPTASSSAVPRIGLQLSISDWLNRGRSLETEALRLQIEINRTLPTNHPTRQAFDAWFASWQPFYEKYIGPNATDLAKSDVSVNYTEFDQALVRYKLQFDTIGNDFLAQPQARGSLFRPTPFAPPTPGAAGLPWWVWAGAGVAVAGVGYLVYRKIQEGRAKLAYVDRHAPAIVERFVPGYGKEITEYSRAGR